MGKNMVEIGDVGIDALFIQVRVDAPVIFEVPAGEQAGVPQLFGKTFPDHPVKPRCIIQYVKLACEFLYPTLDELYIKMQ